MPSSTVTQNAAERRKWASASFTASTKRTDTDGFVTCNDCSYHKFRHIPGTFTTEHDSQQSLEGWLVEMETNDSGSWLEIGRIIGTDSEALHSRVYPVCPDKQENNATSQALTGKGRILLVNKKPQRACAYTVVASSSQGAAVNSEVKIEEA